MPRSVSGMSPGMPPPPTGVQGGVDRKRPAPPDVRSTPQQQIKLLASLVGICSTAMKLFVF